LIAKTNLAQRFANFDIGQRTLLSCYRYCEVNEIETIQPIDGYISFIIRQLFGRTSPPAMHKIPLSETRDNEPLASSAEWIHTRPQFQVRPEGLPHPESSNRSDDTAILRDWWWTEKISIHGISAWYLSCL